MYYFNLGSKVRFGRIPRGSGNDGGEDPDDATDYDSEEQNISTVEQTIISHTRILALQLIEVSKYVSYGGRWATTSSRMSKPNQF